MDLTGKQFLKNLLFLLISNLILIGFNNLASASDEIEFKDKLVVLYKRADNIKERNLTIPTKGLGVLPFETLLGNVIKKLTESGKIPSKYNSSSGNTAQVFRFQETSEEVAFVESELEELDAYVVKVNQIDLVDLLKKGLESEIGVIRVIKDFEVFLPQLPRFQEQLKIGSSGNQTSCNPDSEPLPNDPYNLENWHYERTGLVKAWNDTCNCPTEIQPSKCNVKEHPEFCNVSDPNVIIAILDNGFSIGAQVGTTGHPDLIDRADINASRSVVSNSDPFDFDSSDEPSNEVVFDHGTASAISASGTANNNKSHAGINWNAKIWAIRIGKGAGASTSDILSGINHVLEKARELSISHFFINISYGSGGCNKYLAQEINEFAGANVKRQGGLIALSSGNDGCFQDFEDVAPDVIVVGATGAGGPCDDIGVASYSNYGALTDIFSPSGFVVDNRDTRVQHFRLGKLRINGTSFSAPSLAGYGTLLWSRYPDLPPHDIEKILKVSSFNSLSLFNNVPSRERIFKSHSAQVKIDDAISLKSQILNLIISTNPSGENQNLYAEIKNQVLITASLPSSNEGLKLEALNLPVGAVFESASGFGTISQNFLWTPSLFQANNKFQVTFLVKNSQDKVIGYKKILFSVLEKPKNQSPIVNAGLDKTVRPKQVVRFEDASAFDPDNEVLTYEWEVIEPQIKVVRISPWRLNKGGFYAYGTDKGLVDIKFKLTVSDGTNTVSDEVVYTVKNHAPIADTGPLKKVRRNTLIHIGSLKSIDPDGDPIKFTWTQINGPKVELSDLNLQFPSFVTPNELTTQGQEIIFRLTVEDDYGGSATDDDYIYVVR